MSFGSVYDIKEAMKIGFEDKRADSDAISIGVSPLLHGTDAHRRKLEAVEEPDIHEHVRVVPGR
jgi:hypothetical protein